MLTIYERPRCKLRSEGLAKCGGK